MKLLKVDTLVQARERLLKAAKECLPETEQVALADASDRILAEDIVSGEMIPAFRRSSVDGYAVCSKDTAGATESIPVFLKVLEEVEIGHPAISKIEPGTCAYVPTGGMVPEGADAMVMVEYSERSLKREPGLVRRRREHWQRLAWCRFRFLNRGRWQFYRRATNWSGSIRFLDRDRCGILIHGRFPVM